MYPQKTTTPKGFMALNNANNHPGMMVVNAPFKVPTLVVNVWSGSEALALLGSVVSPLGGRKAQGEEVWMLGS